MISIWEDDHLFAKEQHKCLYNDGGEGGELKAGYHKSQCLLSFYLHILMKDSF